MRQSAGRGATAEPVPTHGSYVLEIPASERRSWWKRAARPGAITSLALLVALGAFVCLQVVSVYREFWHVSKSLGEREALFRLCKRGGNAAQ